jgi:hypothetical protein
MRGGMARYVLAASLARVSDGGAIVAVVLLVNTSGGSPAAAGLLGACVTAPHLLGRSWPAASDAVAAELNDRPRKRLQFKKPIEMIGPLLLR